MSLTCVDRFERFGDALDSYKRVLCCSFTTAGYLTRASRRA
jgi:hypothetical protein